MYEEIKKLLRAGNTESALKLLAEQNDDAIVLLNNFKTIQNQSGLGILNFTQSMQANAQIVNAALQLVRDAEEKANQPKTTPQSIPTRLEKKDKLSIFLSYSHKDEAIKEDLNAHLIGLKRQGYIDTWNDREIPIGEEWDDEIKSQLTHADIILLLVSVNFINSTYIWENELKEAMERHRHKEAVVIPIFIKPCDWTGMPFGKIQGLPKDAIPVSEHKNQDKVLMEVAKGIRSVVERLRKK